MAGKALQLDTIAYNSKRRRVWHEGRKLVRDALLYLLCLVLRGFLSEKQDLAPSGMEVLQEA